MDDYLPVEGFLQYRLAVGMIIKAEPNARAKKPAYHLTIDFGPWGIKESSAQITRRYQPDTLVGRQIVAVLNFPPRQVAGVLSEVLVLGAVAGSDDVVLLSLDQTVENGTVIS